MHTNTETFTHDENGFSRPSGGSLFTRLFTRFNLMAEAVRLERAPSHAARHQQSASRSTVSVDDVTLVADSETCKPRSEKKAASAPDCLSRYLERVDQRIQRAKPRRFRLPRPPLVRAWPVVREMALVMGGTVVLVLALPPAFDALPAPFDIREGESAAAQARAALLGASVVGALFLFNFVPRVAASERLPSALASAHKASARASALAGPLGGGGVCSRL